MATHHPERSILFTVDVEEFDTALEFGHAIPLSEQVAVSTRGLISLNQQLESNNVRATLFTTANYALHEPVLMGQLAARHEIASHGYYHTTFEPADLLTSRLALEELLGRPVTGFRRARMGYVNPVDVQQAGYQYNSSLHPTWLPGRYNHWGEPRHPFRESGVWQIPASVTPSLRLPLFWLSLKNFPFALYKQLCRQTLRSDGFLNLYVHPWEFTDLAAYDQIPAYVRRHSSGLLLDRVDALVQDLKGRGEFMTMQEFAEGLPR
ncbi:peptidoglycan/xylan/chitin deacetylase (PgdA/CDA1 family) [Spirosoma lacussanchae]|uniref:polysaccharide deacetylase family protein n=1 Tax=Spirosoma lacussanchae TaxID=1884249 RepID=UPI001108C967|nr:polysaccharide deacetylase family protein [Spirosoma lacussanchae]